MTDEVSFRFTIITNSLSAAEVFSSMTVLHIAPCVFEDLVPTCNYGGLL